MKRLLVLLLVLTGCQAPIEEPQPLTESSELAWQPQGASYVFVCRVDEGMDCVAKSIGEIEGKEILIKKD